MAKSKSVNSLDMFGNMAKLNSKPSRSKNNEGLTSNEVRKKFHITFYNEDVVFYETEVEENEMIKAPDNTPIKESDAQYDYSFTGWDQKLTAAISDTEFHAEFDKTLHTYEVNFRIDGEIVETQTVSYGNLPNTPKVSTEKPNDGAYHYSFVKWEPALTQTVTKDTDIQAIYTKELLSHTVTFLNDAGMEIHKISVIHGETAVYNFEAPLKEADDTYEYQFSGWDHPEKLQSVTDDFTVSPLFDKSEKETVKITEPEVVISEPTTSNITEPTPVIMNEPTSIPVVTSNESVNITASSNIPVRMTASDIVPSTPVPASSPEPVTVENTAPVKGKVGRPATKKGIAKKVNVLFTEDTMEVINTAKVFFDGNMTKYLETLIMEDYKKNKDLYDTLAKTKRV